MRWDRVSRRKPHVPWFYPIVFPGGASYMFTGNIKVRVNLPANEQPLSRLEMEQRRMQIWLPGIWLENVNYGFKGVGSYY